MELAVIGRRLCEPLTGVGRYLSRLLYHWHDLPTRFDRIVVHTPAEPTGVDGLFRGRIELRIVPDRFSPLVWENVALLPHLESADLIFGVYTVPLARAGDSVVSNLGIYESRPDDFSLASRLRTTPFYWYSARNARLVLANSESTRRDLNLHYGVAPAAVEVVYLGVDERFAPTTAPRSILPPEIRGKYRLPAAPYFLFVGKLSKRRHVPWLVEAFARVRSRAKTPERLLIVGPGEVDVRALAARFEVTESVDHVPHVPIDELAAFYQCAAALVHPTAHEGFSLPIVEASACGTPAITFDHASLEGGLRDAVLIVPPSVAGIEQGLLSIRDPAVRDRLNESARPVVAGFDWRKTAAATMSRLERLATNPTRATTSN